MQVGEQELGSSEGNAGHQNGGQNFHGTLEAAHHDAHPQGHDDGKERELTAGNGADLQDVKVGNLGCHDDRNADGTEGHGGGVGDQGNAACPQGLETKAHEHGCSDGRRRTKSGCTFDETGEGKGDEERLQATVVRHTGEGILDDFKLAGFHGHVVDPHGRDDYPHNWEQTKGCTVQGGAHSKAYGHAPEKNCNNQGAGKAEQGSHMAFGLLDCQHVEQNKERDCSAQGG